MYQRVDLTMQWPLKQQDLEKYVQEYIEALTPIKANYSLIVRIFRSIDLTSLNETDTRESIIEFCKKAQSPLGQVAAVCVYPAFTRLVAQAFTGTSIKTAVVANFPKGDEKLDAVLIEISQAIENGAQEIDVVFPFSRYLAGDRNYAYHFIAACKAACGDEVALKVILETGALGELGIIADACHDAIHAGADFVKTSTGKITVGATLQAAGAMLLAIKHATLTLNRPIGLKVSGGIREWQQAAQYLALADGIMGANWATPTTFRIGASKLVDDLLKLELF